MTAFKKPSDQRGEITFSKTQTQSLALNRIRSEHEAINRAREEKTAHLRELRLEMKTEELVTASATKRDRKP